MSTDESASSSTSATLLGRLRDPTDQAAWKEFVACYGSRIFKWSRKWQLQQADVEDLTQELLVALLGKMRTFDYDPSRSFRGWLHTLTRNACFDLFEARKRERAYVERLAQDRQRAADDLVNEREEEFYREGLDQALARVQLEVSPRDFTIFKSLAIEDRAGAEVAEQHQMSILAIYQVRSRVRKRVKAWLERLGWSRPNERSDDA